MELLPEIVKVALSATAAIAIDRATYRRPKLIAYGGHADSFDIQNGTVHALVVFVQNNGGAPATGIQIGHEITALAQFPLYKIQPSIPAKLTPMNATAALLEIDCLGPGQTLRISYLSNTPFKVLHIRSKEGDAQVINVALMRVFPKWFNYTVVAFAGIGLIHTIIFSFQKIVPKLIPTIRAFIGL